MLGRNKKLLTTTVAARLCGVSHSTLIKWFDGGLIEGFRLPGSGDRRLSLDSLVRFMKDNNMPLPEGMANDRYKVLVVDDDKRVLQLFIAALPPGTFEVSTASDGYTAGLMTQKVKPHLIILDISLPDIDGRKVAEAVRRNIEDRDVIIYAISGVVIDEKEVQDLLRRGIDYFERKPIKMGQFAKKIEGLLDEKFGRR